MSEAESLECGFPNLAPEEKKKPNFAVGLIREMRMKDNKKVILDSEALISYGGKIRLIYALDYFRLFSQYSNTGVGLH